MRNTRDRIRHSVLFELIGLITVTPLGGWVFGVPISHFGVVAVVSTTLAMGWNYAYNLGFDHAMLRLFGSVTKSLRVRIVHAGLFEFGLLCLLVPFIAWYLAVPLWQAFVMDVSLAGFYVLYAFAFNWVYDIVFPVPSEEITA
jgi:uncharacterized membrane protein